MEHFAIRVMPVLERAEVRDVGADMRYLDAAAMAMRSFVPVPSV